MFNRKTWAALAGVGWIGCAAAPSAGGGNPAQDAAATAEIGASAEVAGDVPAAAETVADAAKPEVAETAAETAAEVVAEASAPDVAKPNTTGEYKDPGDFAPDFVKVVDSTGASVAKADLQGHWTVMWFYPLAMTSG